MSRSSLAGYKAGIVSYPGNSKISKIQYPRFSTISTHEKGELGPKIRNARQMGVNWKFR